ncbi:hypothetical protein [Helicobacter pylori]|nr:hypothetical protein [Helicobacter pylori]
MIQTLEQKEISLKNDLQSKCEQILQQELPPNAVKPLALAMGIQGETPRR